MLRRLAPLLFLGMAVHPAGAASANTAGAVAAVVDGSAIATSVDAATTMLADAIQSRIDRHESFEVTFIVQVRTVASLWVDRSLATTTVRDRATWDAAINAYRLRRTVDGAIVDARVDPDARAAALFMTVFRAELFADRTLALKPNARYRVRVHGYVGQKPDPREDDQFVASDEFVFRATS